MDNGAGKIAGGFGVGFDRPACRREARADAGILPFLADVAAPRARSGDAAFPSLAARSRSDRTTMANLARAGLDRRHRGHRTGAGRYSAGAKSFPDPARSGSARSDRTKACESRSAPRRRIDFRKGFEADRSGRSE